jgi:N-acetylglucosaminyldiphosphoundecaprenol N-acetyl-beta-D-mannosaminyltransferase
MDRLNVLSIPVSTGSYKQFVHSLVATAAAKKSEYACVANVHMLVEAYKNRRFAKVVREAAYVTPDGKPLAWAMRLLHGVKQERVAGMDLLPDLLSEAEAANLPVFFYGGTDELLKKTGAYVRRYYAGLTIAGMHSPPFRDLTTLEEKRIVEKINASGAAFVFVVLGCPKQEKWMAGMRGRIQAVMIGVGGALPVMIGDQRRAPRWMQKSGLEWLYRLVQEPGRLFKRYAVTNSFFIYLLMKAYLRKKFLSLV